jgi:hypothetical protein
MTRFKTASEAFDYFLPTIRENGVDFAGTKALFNVGFTIESPTNNSISNHERQWNQEYAEAEWKWYLSGDPSIDKLGIYMVKYPQYGSVWQILTERLTLTMDTSGIETISLRKL